MNTVLIVSRDLRFPEVTGGTDKLAFAYAESLDKTCFDVTFVARGNPKFASSVTTYETCLSLEPVSRYQLLYFAKVAVVSGFMALVASGLARRKRFDLIHVNSNIAAIICRLLMRKSILIYTVNDQLYEYDDRNSVFTNFARFIINGLLEIIASNLTDAVIAVSPVIKAQLVKAGIPPTKITVMSPISQFKENGASLATISSTFQDRVKYILSVGDQNGRKRFDLLIKAMRFLSDDYHLVLVGDGPENDSLRRLVIELGLSDRVLTLSHLSSAELSMWYRKASLYAIVSEREGMPTTIVEALFSGTRVLYVLPKYAANLRDYFGCQPFMEISDSLEPSEIGKLIFESISKYPANEELRNSTVSWAHSKFASFESLGDALKILYLKLVSNRRDSIRTSKN